MTSPVGRERWLGPALLGLAFLAWGGALSAEYVLDGALVVRDNGLLSPFEPLRIAGLDWWDGTGRPGGLYRPVPLVLLAWLRTLGDGSAFAINFANVLLLGVVAWLRYGLLVKLLGSRAGAREIAFAVAALALVHPTNAELAASQVGMADLLAQALATAAVLRACDAGVPSLLLAGFMSMLAVLSKENGVLVVPLALLFEGCRDADAGTARRRMLLAASWSLVGVLAALAVRYSALGSLASVDDPVYAGFPLIARVASSLATFAEFTLPLVAAPFAQLAVVSHQDVLPASGFGDLRSLLGLAVLLVVALLPLFALRRGRRELAFGAWFFLVAWLPTSNLLVSTGALAASRFLFPGLSALFLVVVLSAWHRRAGRIVLALLGVFFFAMSWREALLWSNPRELYEVQAQRAPDSAYALYDLALEIRAADPVRARELSERAIATPRVEIPGVGIEPEDVLEPRWLAQMALAESAEAEGDTLAAERHYRAAADWAQQGIDARTRIPFIEDWQRSRLASLHKLVALELLRVKELDLEAREALSTQIARDIDDCDRCDPSSAENVRLRSLLLDRRGDSAGRAKLIEEAWLARPNEPLLRILWATELRQRGRSSEALAIDVDVALSIFDSYDRARSLAIAREALAHPDARLAARGRSLLERLAVPDSRLPQSSAIAAEAAQLLRVTPPRK
jgi:hypothetical protein